MRTVGVLLCLCLSACKTAAPLPEPPRTHPASPQADEAPVPELQARTLPDARTGDS